MLKTVFRLFPVFVLALITISALQANISPAQPISDKFDTDRAFTLLKKQCDFGPRPVGVKAHVTTRDFLADELHKYADSVELQTFQYTRSGTTYDLANIIGRFGDTSKPGILLCAHWDTRPTADEERDPINRMKPILGADDGASGVAILLELARMFHSRPPAVPVTIVLLDGEDFGPRLNDMFLGAKYLANQIKGDHPYRFGILLDMVGQKNLRITREQNSESLARSVDDKVWKAAARLGYGSTFLNIPGPNILDDHLALNNAGVPCIDLIDFDYPYWHTLNDTPDKCSPKSLQIVGKTIARVVYSEHP